MQQDVDDVHLYVWLLVSNWVFLFAWCLSEMHMLAALWLDCCFCRLCSWHGELVGPCSRYAADECVCLLAVLEAVLEHLEASEQGVLQQLSADVIQMLNSQLKPQVRWQK